MDQNTNAKLMMEQATMLERYRQCRATMRELHNEVLDSPAPWMMISAWLCLRFEYNGRQ